MDIPPRDITPLTLAVLEGKLNLVVNLVQRQVELNVHSDVYDDVRRVWRMETPLITAARLGHLDIVKVLVEGGAYLDTPDMTLGKSPLNWACNRNHTDVALELILAGSSVNMKDYTNETPIVEAIACRNHVLVNAILNSGLLLDVHLNYDRDTGLLFALCLSEIEIAKGFIQAGADVNRMNIEGMDALSLVLNMPKPPHTLLPLCHMLLAVKCNITRNHLTKVNQLYIKSKDYGCLHSILQTAGQVPLRLTDICRQQLREVLRTKMKGTSIQPCIPLLPLPQRLLDYLSLTYL